MGVPVSLLADVDGWELAEDAELDELLHALHTARTAAMVAIVTLKAVLRVFI
jgi:hypothetical protein